MTNLSPFHSYNDVHIFSKSQRIPHSTNKDPRRQPFSSPFLFSWWESWSTRSLWFWERMLQQSTHFSSKTLSGPFEIFFKSSIIPKRIKLKGQIWRLECRSLDFKYSFFLLLLTVYALLFNVKRNCACSQEAKNVLENFSRVLIRLRCFHPQVYLISVITHWLVQVASQLTMLHWSMTFHKPSNLA